MAETSAQPERKNRPASKLPVVSLKPADRDGADQATEVANRVDPGDGCRRGRTAEERGGSGQNEVFMRIEADRRHRHAGKRPEAPREQRGGEHPDCGGKAGEERDSSVAHACGRLRNRR